MKVKAFKASFYIADDLLEPDVKIQLFKKITKFDIWPSETSKTTLFWQNVKEFCQQAKISQEFENTEQTIKQPKINLTDVYTLKRLWMFCGVGYLRASPMVPNM